MKISESKCTWTYVGFDQFPIRDNKKKLRELIENHYATKF
jgi:hypothetical protein